jgi:hypothetical protein
MQGQRATTLAIKSLKASSSLYTHFSGWRIEQALHTMRRAGGRTRKNMAWIFGGVGVCLMFVRRRRYGRATMERETDANRMKEVTTAAAADTQLHTQITAAIFFLLMSLRNSYPSPYIMALIFRHPIKNFRCKTVSK